MMKLQELPPQSENLVSSAVLFGPLPVLVGLIFGAILGSFLTVVISRGPVIWGLVDPDGPLPTPYSLARPRSHCPGCKNQLGLRDLVPILSFFANRGACRQCKAKIPRLYPVMEIGGAIIGAVSLILFTSPLAWGGALFFLLSLLGLGAIDARTGYLPDAMTLPLLAIGLALSIGGPFGPWSMALIGAGLGYGTFTALAFLYRQIRGQDGLGAGDAKLLGAIGAFTGPFALPFVVLIAAGSALVTVAVGALRSKEQMTAETEIRFGPYLAMGGSVAFVLQQLGVIALT